MINIVMVMVILAKVLVYGEPVTRHDSKESMQYWRHMNQADSDLEEGQCYEPSYRVAELKR